MLLVRSHVSRVFTLQLAQALTIATQYSCVRKQSQTPTPDSDDEVTVINYKHQKFRLLTLLAKVYAMCFASLSIEAFYDRVRAERAHDNHTNLSSLHAFTAGLKAYTTSEALDGVEECRKMCGGHGYMVTSSLPEIIGAYAGAYIRGRKFCDVVASRSVLDQEHGEDWKGRGGGWTSLLPCQRH